LTCKLCGISFANFALKTVLTAKGAKFFAKAAKRVQDNTDLRHYTVLKNLEYQSKTWYSDKLHIV
jgi:hypothetical protein